MSTIQESITSITKEHTTRRHLALVVCMIAVATVFAVFWSLHIKGITLASGDLICGMEEHTHTADCYAWVPVEDATEDGSELEETETAAEPEEGTDTEASSETEESTEPEIGTEAEENTDTESVAEIEEETETESEAGSTEVASETVTESATESVSTETGTEPLTEDGSEALTEEETESAQVGDTKVIDGVEYVYTLICGMEEHTHTDECYADEDSEETESEEETANVSSLTAGVSFLGSTRLGSSGSGDSSGVSAASLEEEDNNGSNNGISTTADEPMVASILTSSGTAGDTYYFADSTTLENVAENQDETYILYTVIDGIYYVVSADDGSLLECTDLTGYTSTDDKTAASTTVGVYVWEKDSAGEPVFKFTTESSDDDFADYRWDATSMSTLETNGSGDYTLYNEENDCYLASGIITYSDSYAQTDTTKAGTAIPMSGDGNIVYSVTFSAYRHSGTWAEFNFDVYDTTGNKIDINAKFYYSSASSYNKQLTVTAADGASYQAYSYGTLSMTKNDVYEFTVIRDGSNICIYIYNTTQDELYVYVVDGLNLDETIYSQLSVYNGEFSSTAEVLMISDSNETDESISNATETDGSYTLDAGKINAVSDTVKTLTGDFDVTYTFMNTSKGSENYENFVIELNNDAGVYITVRADNDGWVAYNTDADDYIEFLTASTDFTDWDTWNSKIANGTSCTARVIRRGNTFLIITTSAGHTSVAYAEVSEFNGTVANVYLAGENCKLSDITYTNNTATEHIYSVVSSNSDPITLTADTGDDSVWTVDDTNSDNESIYLQGEEDNGSAVLAWVKGTSSTVKGLTSDTTITFSAARIREYTAHFDPTNGTTATYAGSTVYYYENTSATTTTAASSGSYALKSYSDEKGDCYIILPTAVSGNYYPYVLAGWYDIYNQKYYTTPTDNTSVEITGHTVFYADWEISSEQYVNGTETGVIESLDTSSFVTTKVFDMNDLFNLYSTCYTEDFVLTSGTYSTYVNAASHQEVWTIAYDSSTKSLLNNTLGSTGLGFLFTNNRALSSTLNTQDSNTGGQGSLSYVIGRNNNNYGAGFYQGIVNAVMTDSSVDLRDVLFSESGSFQVGGTAELSDSTGYLGVNYLGNGNYLYRYDSDSGYYYFDSSKNAAFYSGSRFYLYNYTVKVNRDSSANDFLPFNYNQMSNYVVNQYYANYWFGMTSEIDFYLPDDVGYYDTNTSTYGNQSTKDSDMIFRFMGDDDVWVYVDDTLVLDLGGIHGAIYGEINFSTGKIIYITNTDYADSKITSEATKTYTQLCIDQSSTVFQYDSDMIYEEDNILYIYVTGDKTSDVKLVTKDTANATKVPVGYTTTYASTGADTGSGSHTLDIYYLERGGSESNCAIAYSISSATYNLKLNKVDEAGTDQTDSAEFTFYIDSAFETEASLAKTLDGEDGYSKFKSSETAYDLREGVNYYVKETKSPDGLTASGRYFTVCLENNVLTIVVYDSSNTALNTYQYTLTVAKNTNTNEYECTVTYDEETDKTSWKYVKQDSIKVTPTVSAAETVTYYDIEFTIVNTAEYELPDTGSMGDFPYERTGTAMVLVSVIGLLMTAFYQLVRVRTFSMAGRNIGYKEEKTRQTRRYFLRMRVRGHPRERSITRGHPRDRPEVRGSSSMHGSAERSRGTGPGSG